MPSGIDLLETSCRVVALPVRLVRYSLLTWIVWQRTRWGFRSFSCFRTSFTASSFQPTYGYGVTFSTDVRSESDVRQSPRPLLLQPLLLKRPPPLKSSRAWELGMACLMAVTRKTAGTALPAVFLVTAMSTTICPRLWILLPACRMRSGTTAPTAAAVFLSLTRASP